MKKDVALKKSKLLQCRLSFVIQIIRSYLYCTNDNYFAFCLGTSTISQAISEMKKDVALKKQAILVQAIQPLRLYMNICYLKKTKPLHVCLKTSTISQVISEMKKRLLLSLKSDIPQSRNTNCSGRLSTVDLLIKLACFVKNANCIFNIKGANLNYLVQGQYKEVVCTGPSPSVRLPCPSARYPLSLRLYDHICNI